MKYISDKTTIRLVIILPLIALLFIIWEDNYYDQKSEQTELVRDCLEWKKQYPIMSNIPSDGFNFKGGTWIIQLNNNEWKRINASVHTYWVSEIKKGLRSKTLDGTTFKGAGHSNLKGYKTVDFSGTGCMLITSEKDIFYQWLRVKPKVKSNQNANTSDFRTKPRKEEKALPCAKPKTKNPCS